MSCSISLQPPSDLHVADDGRVAIPFYRMLFFSFQEHAALFIVALTYFFLVKSYYELDLVDRITKVFLGLLGLVATSLLLGGIYRFYVYVTDTRPHHPIAQLFRDLSSLLRNRKQMSLIIPTALSLAIFMETYRKAKVEIVPNADFFWDETFTRWDQVVHFGTLPWQWLQPVLDIRS